MTANKDAVSDQRMEEGQVKLVCTLVKNPKP